MILTYPKEKSGNHIILISLVLSIQHVQFGRVLGMQTRTGDVVLLEDILEEAKNRMLERMRRSNSETFYLEIHVC